MESSAAHPGGVAARSGTRATVEAAAPGTRTHGRAPIAVLSLAALALLAGCATQRVKGPPPRCPEVVHAQIERLMPDDASDKAGWATDICAAFTAQQIVPTTQNLCAVLAVTEQESGFHVAPVVPGLGRIAREEIYRRAAARHVPRLLVDAALHLKSPNGERYSDRLKKARTEKQLSAIFGDLIGMVPLGRRLFGGLNPVHTGGPMQVSINFAEAHDDGYPYPVDGSIRQEVFSRRGGMYFGIAHLLGYPTHYPDIIYRFADFNAGWYASRNAAFQAAVSKASGIKLALDGDLIRYGSDTPGATERAVRTLGPRLGLNDDDIRDALEQGEAWEFSATPLYDRVYALAERAAGKPLPHAILPGITLESPKITRKLTTAWFAKRVDSRWKRCMARATGR
ncbi:MAG TPA: DUF1615 domain-containing protein [Rhodanobacteraceae bacterium]|nr:DUF1615 domain-containing protein [Rhodanobacteraceae bacterium]